MEAIFIAVMLCGNAIGAVGVTDEGIVAAGRHEVSAEQAEMLLKVSRHALSLPDNRSFIGNFSIDKTLYEKYGFICPEEA